MPYSYCYPILAPDGTPLTRDFPMKKETGADTDHPWHRAERGELDISTCRDEIRELGAACGEKIDLFKLLKYLGGDGGVRESMVACVRRLREAGYKAAIVTNNIAEGREFWRPMIPLDELFDIVIDSSEVGVRKPDPRIFELALQQLGVAAENAVFLDDFEGHVRGAEAVGMIGVLVESDPTAAIDRVDSLIA